MNNYIEYGMFGLKLGTGRRLVATWLLPCGVLRCKPSREGKLWTTTVEPRRDVGGAEVTLAHTVMIHKLTPVHS